MNTKPFRSLAAAVLLLSAAASVPGISSAAPAPATPVNLWPGKPPGDAKELPPEADLTKPTDALVGGRRIIKLGNVSTPQLTVYPPPAGKANGAAVVICPGGGHYILAYDLEGTEVAEWLQGIGVTALLLKYRVPFRSPEKRWEAAVQDGQRAVSLARTRAAEWGIDPKRIGILGFSAGGELAARTALLGDQRQYAAVDDIDKASSRPDFAVLIYPGLMMKKDKPELLPDVVVSSSAPPMFLAHAQDDPVSVLNSLLLATELKRAGVSAELHVYAAGGHGYGMRHVEGLPVTDWPVPCEAWMKGMKLLGPK